METEIDICTYCGLPSKKSAKDTNYPKYCECVSYSVELIIWFERELGKYWIYKFIPSLYLRFHTGVTTGVYCIKFNDVPVYVGKAADVTQRLIQHSCNICKRPHLFGLEEKDVETGRVKVSVEVLEELDSPEDPEDKESFYVKELKPLLQGNSKNCVSLKERKRRVQALIYR